MYRFYFLIAFLIYFSISGYAQDSAAFKKYDQHIQFANKYENSALFAECMQELSLAIQIAEENNWKEKEIETTLLLAEIKRKTADHAEGLSLLRNLESSVNFPKLHLRKLGRVAALLNGYSSELTNSYEYRDSVLLYLDSAIKIADQNGLIKEKAGLYNELGYTLGAFNVDSSLFYLKKAADLYKENNIIANYIVVKTNLLRTYVSISDYEKADSIVSELMILTQDTSFNEPEVKLEFYRTLTFYYKKIGDNSNFYIWSVEKYKTMAQVLKNSNSFKLNSYRALYETKKFQEEVAQKVILLDEETKKTNKVISYLIILVFGISVIITLFVREKKLKSALRTLNEKYHMLLIESNHRIKNNLQMIISMLEYSSKNLKDKDESAFNKMSGKIKTISALHKHLYLDVHNELVNINTYFEEISSLYEDLLSGQFKIEMRIDTIMLESERIIYFGLILNELLSNTFEHHDGINKKVTIKVSENANTNAFYFSYQDNSSFKVNAQMGTGIELIKQLVKRVEGRNLKVDGSSGRFQFEFSV